MTMVPTTPRRGPGRPPKNRPPAESLAYTTDDGPVGAIPSRTPEEVYEDHEAVASAELAEQGMLAQVRLEAANLNISEAAYLALLKHAPPETLVALAREQGISRPMEPFMSIGESMLDDLGSGVDTKTDWRRLAQTLLSEDEAKEWTIMWDQPRDDGYVHTWSKVKRDAANIARKTRMGFTMVPSAPLKPVPTLPCDIPYANGQRCPYHGYTPDEVEEHQEAKHPKTYAAREARIRREREDRMLAIQQATLDAAQGKGAPSADVRALQDQVNRLEQLLAAREPESASTT